MSLLLGITVRNLERIAYFATYVVLKADEEARDKNLADLEAETEAGVVIDAPNRNELSVAGYTVDPLKRSSIEIRAHGERLLAGPRNRECPLFLAYSVPLG